MEPVVTSVATLTMWEPDLVGLWCTSEGLTSEMDRMASSSTCCCWSPIPSPACLWTVHVSTLGLYGCDAVAWRMLLTNWTAMQPRQQGLSTRLLHQACVG